MTAILDREFFCTERERNEEEPTERRPLNQERTRGNQKSQKLTELRSARGSDPSRLCCWEVSEGVWQLLHRAAFRGK